MFILKMASKAFWTVVVLFLAVLVWGVWFSVESARLLTDRMQEKTWKLSSKVYASVPILYPGAELSSATLEKYLDSFGYSRSSSDMPKTGQWLKLNRRYIIAHRAFDEASQKVPARMIAIDLEGGKVDRIYELVEGISERPLDTLALEPQVIGFLSGDRLQERTVVRLQDVPMTLQQAILEMEDRNFYDHHGISIKGVGRALFHNVFGGAGMQGGSTLTQQLMKNFFLTQERTLSRKVREAVMTIVAETLYDKTQILEAYINEIYLGQNGPVSIHGFEEASQFYFSKELSKSTLSEQALLVGLISSPGRYSPYKDLKRATERRNLVLGVLSKSGKISSQDFEQAKLEKVEPRGKRVQMKSVSYFLDFVRSELLSRFSKSALEEDGYSVFTTMDTHIQEAADSAIVEGLASIEKKLKIKVDDKEHETIQAALVVLQPQTGAIKAMVGGRNYAMSQFNRVTSAKRQPGSSVKPFVLAAALSPRSDGSVVATASTILSDEATTFAYAGREWSPKNFDNKYNGNVTVRKALEKSMNVATVNLASMVGLESLAEFYKRLGFQHVSAVPSLAIGALEATPLELARAYTIFPNGGARSDPISILSVTDTLHRPLDQKSPAFEKIISREAAYIVSHLMEGVLNQGTAKRARSLGLLGPFAGKTGTTNDYKDNWFVGFSKDLLAVVWVGYDEPKSIGLTGGATALEIWVKLMRNVYGNKSPGDFPVPQNIEWVDIDPDLGCVGAKDKNLLHEVFLSGTTPRKCSSNR